MEFMDKPEIYNRFCDIMKDFKSQAIDTPNKAIQEVSSLFKGHSKLLQVEPHEFPTTLIGPI